jgi:MFS family permease
MKGRLAPQVIGLGAVSLFTDISGEMILSLLPGYLVLLAHGPAGGALFLGVIEGLAELVASAGRLFSGRLADRMRRRKPLTLLGYAISSGVRPLVALCTAGWQVLLVRFADRVGKGLRQSPRDALIADVTPPEQRALAFSVNQSMDHVGAVLGALLAFVLLGQLAHLPRLQALRTVFWAAAVPGALSVLVLWIFVREPPASSAPAQPATPGAPAAAATLGPGLRRYLLAVAIFNLGNSSDLFILVLAAQLGVPAALVPVLWAVLQAVKAISSPLAGWLADRLGRRPLILVGWSLYAVLYAAFAWVPSGAALWPLVVVYGLHHGATEGTEKAWVADLALPGARAHAYAVFHTVSGVGLLVASASFGLLWQWAGRTAAFLTGSVLAAAGALTLIALGRGISKPAADVSP